MSAKIAIFAEGLFEHHSGKTAHGVIRYGTREVVAVVDSTHAGRTAVEVEPFCLKPVPMVASVREAIELGAESLLIGVAPTGGKLDPAWRPALLEALAAGLDLEAGLHTELAADPELRAAAERSGATLRDLRAAPADLTVPLGPASRAPGVSVVHSVGSDTVIGKKVVTLELDRAARERGLRSVYVPTGQTGVAIAGWGMAVDHVISDYVAGAAERLVHEGPSTATCCSWRAREPSSIPPTPESLSGCCTARPPTCWCWSTRRAPPPCATTPTCHCRRYPTWWPPTRRSPPPCARHAWPRSR